MAVITIPGRAGIARSIRSNQLFIAWGTGSEEWTGSEKVSEDSTQTSLFREIGRRVVDETYFVIGDDQGSLVTPSGRWRISENPTNQLYVKAQFDYADGNGYTIRDEYNNYVFRTNIFVYFEQSKLRSLFKLSDIF